MMVLLSDNPSAVGTCVEVRDLLGLNLYTVLNSGVDAGVKSQSAKAVLSSLLNSRVLRNCGELTLSRASSGITGRS